MAYTPSDPLLASRVRRIGGGDQAGRCVLYVMSRDQRAADNHALIAAQQHALAAQLPFAVAFCLMPKSGHRAREHYEFMQSGLREVEATLTTYKIPFMMLIGDPTERLGGLFHHVQPDAVYFDYNPLRGPRALHEKLALTAMCPVYEVDTHNVVPVWIASDKKEVGARTLRPRIHRHLTNYLVEPPKLQVHPYAWHGPIIPMSELGSHIQEVLQALPSNGQSLTFMSGTKAAHQQLTDFIANRLAHYATDRNDPIKDGLSGLSPYLHFGQISSLRVHLEVMQVAKQPELAESAATLLEELIVRKELSDNFCHYEPYYDSLKGAAGWSQQTLQDHAKDVREHLYSQEQLVAGKTHDPAWNAAQLQMVHTGKMHGYMRMYWAKKVLEWSNTPQAALETLIYLNDFYSLDGGDPNGYVGILWSVAGVHDRAWAERPIYGKIRSMMYTGLRRKFLIQAYEEKWL